MLGRPSRGVQYVILHDEEGCLPASFVSNSSHSTYATPHLTQLIIISTDHSAARLDRKHNKRRGANNIGVAPTVLLPPALARKSFLSSLAEFSDSGLMTVEVVEQALCILGAVVVDNLCWEIVRDFLDQWLELGVDLVEGESVLQAPLLDKALPCL